MRECECECNAGTAWRNGECVCVRCGKGDKRREDGRRREDSVKGKVVEKVYPSGGVEWCQFGNRTLDLR